jgi:hypothetical protein
VVLQSIQSRCSKRPRYRRRVELSWNWLLVSSIDAQTEYCGYWFRKPALPLARCTGCAGFPRLTDWAAVKPPSESSSSLPFLQSFAQQNLARRPQPADTSHGLLLPSAHAGCGDPLIAGVPSPLRSACRVWLPSARFSPAESGPALFHAGSARGIRPSERSPATRSSGVSTRRRPLAVSLRR